MVLSGTRSICSAAQELTAEQLEDLLPQCNLGMNCLKQMLDLSVIYAELIKSGIILLGHKLGLLSSMVLELKNLSSRLATIALSLYLSLSLCLCACVCVHMSFHA